MFYRRKIILALLQTSGGHLEKIRLQKLLFLFTKTQAKAEYDFIPYKYGCYSYSANADLNAMVKRGLLSADEKSIRKHDQVDYLKQLKPADNELLLDIQGKYGQMNANVLMKYTYVNFPFYATKSEVAENILSIEEMERVTRAKPNGTQTILFTIGYEGISLEEYLVRLIKNDVNVLVDVRRNAMSMKYGFSKNQLIKYCDSVGIGYVHIPDVGIHSHQRQELNTQDDYDKLFAEYRNDNLSITQSSQHEILELLKQHKRIALTCFEADICQCHRKHLAEAIEALPEFNYVVAHI